MSWLELRPQRALEALELLLLLHPGRETNLYPHLLLNHPLAHVTRESYQSTQDAA